MNTRRKIALAATTAVLGAGLAVPPTAGALTGSQPTRTSPTATVQALVADAGKAAVIAEAPQGSGAVEAAPARTKVKFPYGRYGAVVGYKAKGTATAKVRYPNGRNEWFVVATNQRIYHAWSGVTKWYEMPNGGRAKIVRGYPKVKMIGYYKPRVAVIGTNGKAYCSHWTDTKWTTWYRCKP
ncbi:hypothetical protein ACH4SP_11350 [Streptomyces sp. NPDC021093]|uniref:hypothetical protein n=1 Tax=Streptomyces sp. NPDC021093 TaxID=3365112 RepID=UPI00379784D7